MIITSAVQARTGRESHPVSGPTRAAIQDSLALSRDALVGVARAPAVLIADRRIDGCSYRGGAVFEKLRVGSAAKVALDTVEQGNPLVDVLPRTLKSNQ
jgi:hypothetical protein